MLISIITRIIRPEGALEAARSVQRARAAAPGVKVRHILAYWTGPEDPHTLIADWLTELIRDCPPGWIFGLDDDTIMHPQFLACLERSAAEYPDALAFLFGMDYPQFPRGILRPKLPPRGGHVDGGQVALQRDYAVREAWPHGGYGDGLYLANLYERAPDRWRCIPDVVTYHNYQRRSATWRSS